MKINIWIRKEDVDDLAYFLSDNFNWDKEMKLDVWYESPTFANVGSSNTFLQISITFDQFKRLEDL
jgi:hypothetical protein